VQHVLSLGLGGLLVILAVRYAADRSGVPAAVLFVLTGLVLSETPGPNAELKPDVVLDLVIPPLLYAAALNASLIDIRTNMRLIASLSVGLVLVTAAVVAGGLTLVVPDLQFAAALALGAAVAPPDPVAALAIGRRARLPARLTTLIEGEGLLNDATALTLYGIAVTAVVGSGFAPPEGLLRFVLAVAGGLASGVAVAYAVRLARRRLDDPLLENAISLATPFAAYLLAEQIEGSGVLAVVVAGLWLGHQAPVLESGATRLQTRAVWRLIEFVLEGYVFLLIGQQLPDVIDGLGAYSPGTVAAAAGVTVAAVLFVRPLWLLILRRRTAEEAAVASGETPGKRTAPLNGREITALWWAGTRGVITLATAFALPLMADGNEFPDRHLLLFCAYVVVLVTLVGQGLTFAPLLRALRLQADAGDEVRTRAEARLAAVEAALRRLDEMVADEGLPADAARRMRTLYEARRRRAAARIGAFGDGGNVELDRMYAEAEAIGELRRSMLDAEREELVRWRDAGRLPDASLRMLLGELDHQEGLLPG
jgi:monovalent cation/hydrogen antiporter